MSFIKGKKELVFELVLKIPKGKVTTYKEIGRALNIHPREVGKILNENEKLIKIPCHRVVMSSGKIGGYKLGKEKKTALLKREGVEIKDDKIDMKKCYFRL